MTRKHEPSMYVCVLLLITHYSFTQSLLSCFHCQDVKSQGRGATNGPDELLALGQVKDLRTWAGILEHLKMLSLLLCQGESCVFLKKEILSCHRRTAKQRKEDMKHRRASPSSSPAKDDGSIIFVQSFLLSSKDAGCMHI